MSTKGTYAIILLGTSPGVVTELLWWLIHVDQRRVVGAEIWTTGTDDPTYAGSSGYGSFERALFREGGWERLRESLGDRAAALPQPAGFPSWPEPARGLVAPGQLAVFLFGDRRAQLTDIRSPEDAERVSAQLHDRVRSLRRALPPEVELVGALAGGRKTMSASLFGAFSLQARSTDRLMHMLLAPQIEAATEGGRRFFAPTAALREETGLALEDQLGAYEVGFPLVGELAGGAALRAVLDEHPYEGIWPALRANSREEGRHSALLRPQEAGRVDRWCLELRHPEEAEPVCVIEDLSASQAETYAAILAQESDGSTDEQWWRWLLDQGPHRKWSQGGEWERDYKDITRKRRSDLGRALAALTLEGLAHFCVQSMGGRPKRHHIPAWARVRVELPDSDFYRS